MDRFSIDSLAGITFERKPVMKYVDGAFVLKYDPDQPRDEAGRFGSNGGSVEPTDAQYNALERYVGEQYQDINAYLRHNTVNGFDRISIANQVSLIDSLMSPLGEDTVLYRGVQPGNTSDMLRTLEPGDTFLDKGFVSTSQNAEFAQGWQDVPFSGSEGVLLTINAPASTQGIDILKLSGGSENAPLFYGTNLEEEREVILQRDTTFEVVSNSDGRMEVKVVR
jgi:hypothetical protein